MIKTILDGQSINLQARQMVYALATVLDKKNPHSEIILNAEDLLRFINNSHTEKWTDIHLLTHQICTHLTQNPIIIQSPDSQNFTFINWLSHLEIKDGKIYTQFSTKVTEYILNNKGLPHAQLLWDLRPYKSKFTAQLMTLFEAQNNKRQEDIEFIFDYKLDKLKSFFEVQKKYTRFFDFERFVLLATQKELEENDILPFWFSFEKIKKGRSIDAIRFTVYLRPKVLLDLRPQLIANQNGEGSQRDIFDEQRAGSFNKEQQKIFDKITQKFGVGKAFAQNVMNNLTETQAGGYLELVKFGVNKTLAYTMVKKYCNSQKVKGKEVEYIQLLIQQTQKKEAYLADNSLGATLLEKALKYENH